MAWWRIKKNKTTEADVRFLYLLCLGQEAHTENEYKKRKGTSLHGTAASLLGSKTFKNTILSVATNPHALPHHSLDDSQKKSIINGLNCHFNIKIKGEIENWFRLLKGTFQSARFQKAFRVHNSEAVLNQFINALETLSTTGLPPIEGAIDEITHMTCRGWAINTSMPTKSLRLNFYINHMFIGQITADGMRRDLEEVYGGTGRFGFEHILNIPQALSNAGRLVLRIKDADTGMPICPAREIISDHIDELTVLQRTAHLLSGNTTDQQEGLKWALPAIQDYAAFPLENYDLYAAALNEPLLPPSYSNDNHFTIVIYGDRANYDALTRSYDSIDGQSYTGRITRIASDYSEFTETMRAVTGDYILLMQAGDMLHQHALAWVAHQIEASPDAALLYADHDYQAPIIPYRERPHFKPVFDYDFLLANSYIGRAYAVKRTAYDSYHHSGKIVSGAIHLDLQLSIYEKIGDRGFAQIPQVLWHLATDETLAHEQKNIIEEHFKRTGIQAAIAPRPDLFGAHTSNTSKIKWPLSKKPEKLAIIIPSKNALELIRPCVESLIDTIQIVNNTEIIIMDNGSDDPLTKTWLSDINTHSMVRVIEHNYPFNWAEINNSALEYTDAEHLLFLNNDTLALERSWDETLRGLLARSEIGAVGARLLYEDGTIQHGGVLLYDASVAVHEAAGQSCDNPHYMNRSALTHHVSAVTGAFLACTRQNFEAVEGFDESFRIIFNDIDFCLKLRAKDLKVLYTPDITFNHLESKSRGYDHQDNEKAKRAKRESDRMKKKWGKTLEQDPYYPTKFARKGKPFTRIESITGKKM
jgi:GT2 family glycosyltransferase